MEFPTTQWSMLALASLNGDSGASAALGNFYRDYRQPVVAFIRHRGVSPDEAEDVAQDFVVHLINKSMLRRADASRGRFRSFLLGALVRFLDDVRTKQHRQKRGGGCAHLSLDDGHFPAIEAAAAPADCAVFDYAWAVELLDRAKRAIETYYLGCNRGDEFAVLQAYLPGEIHPPPYSDAADQLAWSIPAFKTEVHRLRARFRSQLRREIAVTTRSPHEINDEISYLGRVLQNAPAVKPAGRFD
jgi:RNA polymerase sigma-70 factor (ECF subfamily)